MADGLLEGKIVLVTGGGSGIGRATCEALANHGASVAICDIDADSARSTLARLPEGEHRAYSGNIALGADVKRVFAALVGDYGALDCLHNNAGVVNAPAKLASMTEQEWDRVLDVNLKGSWLVLGRALAQMEKQGSGAIVNTASIAGTHGFRQLGPYCASKAGVMALTKVAAAEYAAAGIRVNAVTPGMIATGVGIEGHDGAPDGGPDPAARYGNPDEVAEAVCWLLSDHATYVNGAVLPIDGGWSAVTGPRRKTG